MQAAQSDLIRELMQLVKELDSLQQQSTFMGNSNCPHTETNTTHGQQAYYQGAAFAFEAARDRLCSLVSTAMVNGYKGE